MKLLLSTALALGLALPALAEDQMPFLPDAFCEANVGEAVEIAAKMKWDLRSLDDVGVLGLFDQVLVFVKPDGDKVVALARAGCMVSDPMLVLAAEEEKV